MIKRKYGCGITLGLERKFMIRTLVDESNVTFATYETFFREDNGCFVSFCTGREFHGQVVSVIGELPDFKHNDGPFPTHFQDNVMIPGELFGKDPNLFFRLRSKVTLNKTFDKHGLNADTLWAIHSDIFIMMDSDGALFTPHNKFSRTRTSKQDGQNYVFQKGYCAIAQIYLADAKGPFSDDGLRITVNETLGYYGNLEFDQKVPATQNGFHSFGMMFYPVLESPSATECPAEKMVEIPLELYTADGEVFTDPDTIYIKTDAGYLPRSQVAIVNGKAMARFIALGLAP
ncbi:MAG: hypothetical protein MI863_05195, partial [Desulfobacterales bacterium]|nr:hypothetical protein [Desulfobacterales bacterium]